MESRDRDQLILFNKQRVVDKNIHNYSEAFFEYILIWEKWIISA